VAEAFCAVEIGGLFGGEEESIFCVRRKVRPSAWRVGSRWVVVVVVVVVMGRGMDCVGAVMSRVQEEARVVSAVNVETRERLSYRWTHTTLPSPPCTLEGNAGGKRKIKVPKYPMDGTRDEQAQSTHSAEFAPRYVPLKNT